MLAKRQKYGFQYLHKGVREDLILWKQYIKVAAYNEVNLNNINYTVSTKELYTYACEHGMCGFCMNNG